MLPWLGVCTSKTVRGNNLKQDNKSGACFATTLIRPQQVGSQCVKWDFSKHSNDLPDQTGTFPHLCIIVSQVALW